MVLPKQLTIQMESIVSQQFDSLKSRWTLGEVEGDFTDGVGCCDVDFEVKMMVSDPFIVANFDQMLQEVAGRQVDAFEKRCQELHVPHDLIEAAKLLKQ
jgi:ribosome-associated toxin RatA of RatAB toxin-antitoxin module